MPRNGSNNWYVKWWERIKVLIERKQENRQKKIELHLAIVSNLFRRGCVLHDFAGCSTGSPGGAHIRPQGGSFTVKKKQKTKEKRHKQKEEPVRNVQSCVTPASWTKRSKKLIRTKDQKKKTKNYDKTRTSVLKTVWFCDVREHWLKVYER